MIRPRYIFAAAAVLSVTAAQSSNAGQPRVVVMAAPNMTPEPEETILVLREHLSEMHIDVQAFEVDSLPTTAEQWFDQAEKAGKTAPGTLAIIGYQCGATACIVSLVEPRTKTIVQVPVKIPEHQDTTVAFGIAATAREALLGPLFPELERLERQGANPSPPPPSPESAWLHPPAEKAKRIDVKPERPPLWLEGGYHGDHAHPSDGPTHGPWLGVTFEPVRHLGIFLSAGWLGMREGETDLGTVTTHRLSTLLALRVILSLGPAHISAAPVIRFDAVFSRTDPIADSATDDTKLEIKAGGLTTWHLPLTNRLEAVVGAGVLAALLRHGYGIDDANAIGQTVLPESVLSIIWTAGIAWSPL